MVNQLTNNSSDIKRIGFNPKNSTNVLVYVGTQVQHSAPLRWRANGWRCSADDSTNDARVLALPFSANNYMA